MENLTQQEIETANQIGEASGMGIPDLTTQDSSEEDNQVQSSADSEKDTSMQSDKKTSEEEVTDEIDGKKSEESEKTDFQFRQAEKSKTNSVPYSLLKAERAKVANIRDDIANLSKQIEMLRNGDFSNKKEEKVIDDIQEAARVMAEDVNVDPDVLAKIMGKTLELFDKRTSGKIPDNIAEKLAKIDEFDKKQRAAEEVSTFNDEWNDITPSLKKQYPNATNNQINEARELMWKISHSKEFHDKELDYALYKNANQFETILKTTGKTKSSEASKTISATNENYQSVVDDDEQMPNIEDITPEIMRARENRSAQARQSSPKDYRVQNPLR